MLSRRRFILSKLKLRGLCYCRLVSTQTNVGEIEVPFTNGTTLKLSTGRYARFADGACVATLGNTSVLATVVAKAKAGAASFLPLVVDYRQKAAAAGRIPTNFLRRELGPTEREILTSRLVDRSVRPLFPQDFTSDTQLACNTLAVDGTNLPETVAINAASAALALSDVPWSGPIGAVRLGQIENELIVNPTRRELEKSSMNLVVAAAGGCLVVMLEGGANDVLQQDLLKAIKLGAKEAQHVVRAIERLASAHGKRKRAYAAPAQLPAAAALALRALATMKIREILSDFSHDKTSRDAALAELRQTAVAQLRDAGEPALLVDCFNAHLRQTFRDLIFETDVRCDGRALDELRKINCEVSLYEPLHGSAVFQRGQTQVLCTVAFDSPDSALKLDPLTAITSGTKEKSFFLHYEFPSYATGEVGGRGAGPARREAGHGALAERGLAPVVPHQPYTVRLTAEVLESNGELQLHGVGVRRLAGAAGRGRGAQRAGCGSRHRPRDALSGRRPRRLPHPHRPAGHRGLHGRHGLQGGGHEARRDRAAGGREDGRPAAQGGHGGRATRLRREGAHHRHHEQVHRPAEAGPQGEPAGDGGAGGGAARARAAAGPRRHQPAAAVRGDGRAAERAGRAAVLGVRAERGRAGGGARAAGGLAERGARARAGVRRGVRGARRGAARLRRHGGAARRAAARAAAQLAARPPQGAAPVGAGAGGGLGDPREVLRARPGVGADAAVAQGADGAAARRAAQARPQLARRSTHTVYHTTDPVTFF